MEENEWNETRGPDVEWMNDEHYHDPTPAQAAIMRWHSELKEKKEEHDRRKEKVLATFEAVKALIESRGYQLRGYIIIKEADGRTWRMNADYNDRY